MTSTARGKDDAQPSEVDESYLIAVANVARASLALRRWEMENLPSNGSHLGFELFMTLFLEAATRNHQGVMLKHLYLSLPFSEKGLRLHIRRLENEGWIKIEKSSGDIRSSNVLLSHRSLDLIDGYMNAIQRWRASTGAASIQD